MRNFKKPVAVLLAFLLLFHLIGIQSFAMENSETQTVIAESEVSAEEETVPAMDSAEEITDIEPPASAGTALYKTIRRKFLFLWVPAQEKRYIFQRHIVVSRAVIQERQTQGMQVFTGMIIPPSAFGGSSQERTGTYAYCMEMGASFSNTNDLTQSPYWSNLSAIAKQGITYTTMYGFPVNQFGVAKCDAYVAIQIIIWEFEKGYRTLVGRIDLTRLSRELLLKARIMS